MTNIGTFAKAIVGALIAGGGSLVVALDDGIVTAQEGVTCGLAFLIALGAVWGVPNARRSDPQSLGQTINVYNPQPEQFDDAPRP